MAAWKFSAQQHDPLVSFPLLSNFLVEAPATNATSMGSVSAGSSSPAKEDLASRHSAKNSPRCFANAALKAGENNSGLDSSQRSFVQSQIAARSFLKRKNTDLIYGSPAPLVVGARGTEDPAFSPAGVIPNAVDLPARSSSFRASCGDESGGMRHGSAIGGGFGSASLSIMSPSLKFTIPSLNDELKTVTGELNAILHSMPEQRDGSILGNACFTGLRNTEGVASCFDRGNSELVTKSRQSQQQLQEQQLQKNQLLGDVAKGYCLSGNPFADAANPMAQLRETDKSRPLVVRTPVKPYSEDEMRNRGADMSKRRKWGPSDGGVAWGPSTPIGWSNLSSDKCIQPQGGLARHIISEAGPVWQATLRKEQPKPVIQSSGLAVAALPLHVPCNEDRMPEALMLQEQGGERDGVLSQEQIQQVLLAALLDDTPMLPSGEVSAAPLGLCHGPNTPAARPYGAVSPPAARPYGATSSTAAKAAACVRAAPVAVATMRVRAAPVAVATVGVAAATTGTEGDPATPGSGGGRLLLEAPQQAASKSWSDAGDMGALGSLGRKSLHPRATRDRERRRKMADSLHALKAVLPATILGGQQDFGSVLNAAALYIRSMEARLLDLEANRSKWT
ncbi:hypothetical protein CLOM_g6812 [Closterium sp. NIES-68]|nr:hypothetical protein CLOM_g6812 [Closterium sp. NIES-68]GJP72345.1 hypothetical protein CLOP_g3087 [Closterium sp. NIES-67]